MLFDPPLKSAMLLRRYQRFLADIRTPEGEILTIHCPNTGAMTGCGLPGDRIWYSTSPNLKRKYPHSWELTETPDGQLIAVNTQRANQLVRERLQTSVLSEFSHYRNYRSEVTIGNANSRLDFLLQQSRLPNCYIEVKSVTLQRDGWGYFPDSVTTRGQKHLQRLTELALIQERSILLFVVLHSGITQMRIAADIDPTYAHLLQRARAAGVEILCRRAKLSVHEMVLAESLPFCMKGENDA